ncbi:MAG: MinD/ParA family protein [Lysobacteraceae bacterium]|jgi:flagellar biosynthesis protein FlhG|nr:MinD/ParA family protein [Xanthomonadales bacterium]HRF55219.1 MinD/ParA family protein [Aquimonas sp.]
MSAPESLPDQAEGLRKTTPKPVRVICVTGGKGGVGKTSVSVNLAVAMADAGRHVLLLDADLGLANVDVLLGLTPRFTLADVIEGRCTLQDTLLEGPHGLAIVPAASGKRKMAELSAPEQVGLIRAFSELDRDLDVMVIDTAAGISDSVLTFAQAAQDVILVVCNEPASITDAYALIKVLSRERGISRVHVLANMVRSPAEGRELFDKLARVTDRFLDVTISLLGIIPHDEWLRRSIQRQQAVVEAFPASPSAHALRGVARRIDQWTAPSGPRGPVEFFVERMVTPREGATA